MSTATVPPHKPRERKYPPGVIARAFLLCTAVRVFIERAEGWTNKQQHDFNNDHANAMWNHWAERIDVRSMTPTDMLRILRKDIVHWIRTGTVRRPK
jgi:hypothetical protein